MCLSNLVAQHTLAPVRPSFLLFHTCLLHSVKDGFAYENLFKIYIASKTRGHLVLLSNGPLTDSSLYLKAALEISSVEGILLRA